MKIKNPKLTLTVVGDNVRCYAYALDDNNKLVNIEIDSNGTYETVALRQYDDNNGEYHFLGASDFEQPVEISDAVNCTNELHVGIIITDPTKDASCTVYRNVNS